MTEILKKISAEILAKYQVADNTFSYTPKDDWKDRIQVEVGDSKQPDTFYPQVKIMRWDNEVNASFRLVDTIDTATVATDKDKIEWLSNKREAHFYELPVSEEHPEGGYEFEVVLKEKPASNVVQMTMETKSLDFLYQPELTKEELEDGASRPDNVIGSYAVYYKDCPANYVGGKEYKTGKAFHIYRPRIEDANGNWVWGELNIDIEKKLLEVTIPQNFLDKAIYPIISCLGIVCRAGSQRLEIYSGKSGG